MAGRPHSLNGTKAYMIHADFVLHDTAMLGQFLLQNLGLLAQRVEHCSSVHQGCVQRSLGLQHPTKGW